MRCVTHRRDSEYYFGEFVIQSRDAVVDLLHEDCTSRGERFGYHRMVVAIVVLPAVATGVSLMKSGWDIVIFSGINKSAWRFTLRNSEKFSVKLWLVCGDTFHFV